MNSSIIKKAPVNRYKGYMAPAFTSVINELLNTPINKAVEKIQMQTLPAANITKGEDAYTIMLSLPGIKKEEIDISIDNNNLKVMSTAAKQEEQTYRLREFDLSNFKRTFSLPKQVDVASISAKHEAGILTLVLPIAPEAKPKKVEVL